MTRSGVKGNRQPELSLVPLRKESCWGVKQESCGVWQSRLRLFVLDSWGQEERTETLLPISDLGGLLVVSTLSSWVATSHMWPLKLETWLVGLNLKIYFI